MCQNKIVICEFICCFKIVQCGLFHLFSSFWFFVTFFICSYLLSLFNLFNFKAFLIRFCLIGCIVFNTTSMRVWMGLKKIKEYRNERPPIQTLIHCDKNYRKQKKWFLSIKYPWLHAFTIVIVEKYKFCNKN